MGSATCVCISAAVAPGQIAETFTTLTVKNGSSRRPSRSYEKRPAAPSATTRNRISAGWLTAQPERLKRFITPSNEIWPTSGLERQRRDDPALLGRIEFLHAEHDNFRALIDAAGDDDVIALVGFDGDRLQRHVAGGTDGV